MPEQPKDEPGFDVILERLRGVVEQLEGGKQPLEQQLAAFEEGIRLARRGVAILDGAEKRVDVLLGAADGEAPRLAPFEGGDERSDE